MEHIATYTGEDFNPLAPNIHQIQLEDIAHALSMICRANGHFKHFYSVAQHSINCANEAKARGMSTKIQLACLLHDGSEAYVSDITRPVKKHLQRYLEIEEALQDMIYKKFLESVLTDEECVVVKQIDDDMLVCEFESMMDKNVFDRKACVNSEPSFTESDYKTVRNVFLYMASNLINNKKLLTALGVDSCNGGWCVIQLDSLGNSSMQLIQSIDELLEYNADIIMIDIPIGLSDSNEERSFDKIARESLGKRRNSVFPVPCKSAIYNSNSSYESTCAINEKITGKKISRQSWAIIPKIREVDLFLQDNPKMNNMLFENHPELCFVNLLGKPCEYHKSKRGGEAERIIELRKHLDILSLLHNPPYSENSAEAKRDDIIDAAVLAVVGLARIV